MRRVYPEELVAEARKVLDQRDGPSGLRARTAAFLARQALEELLIEIWRKRAPRMARVTMRAQLICLPEYLRDRELARRVFLCFWALSRACHHHFYELTPSVRELHNWIDVVASLANKRGPRGV